MTQRVEFGKILEPQRESSDFANNMYWYSQMAEYQERQGLPAPFSYLPKEGVIGYNAKAPNFSLYDLNYVQAHEVAHLMDHESYHSYEDADFLKAVDVSSEKVYYVIEALRGHSLDSNMALSDIISALSRGGIDVPIGHSAQYWEDERLIYMEIFADISAMEMLDPDSVLIIMQYFPELVGAYRKLVGYAEIE